MTLLEVNKSTFEERLGETFTVTTATGALADAKLIAVESLGRPGSGTPGVKGGGAVRESFSLLLRAKNWRGSQRIYTVAHPALGELDIFLVPVAQDEDGVQLEAIFNFTS